MVKNKQNHANLIKVWPLTGRTLFYARRNSKAGLRVYPMALLLQKWRNFMKSAGKLDENDKNTRTLFRSPLISAAYYCTTNFEPFMDSQLLTRENSSTYFRCWETHMLSESFIGSFYHPSPLSLFVAEKSYLQKCQ